jgi:methionyl-tRNA formyltransferase
MNHDKLKFIFFGTPEISSSTLTILKQYGYLPSLIVTSPDKPKGRKMVISPSPTKTWAIQNKIPFLQPEKLDDDFFTKISEEKSDLFIVVAYGKILPERIINLPQKGTLNIHYSLLPKYRGASPVEATLLNGDTLTGVSIQKMVYKLDSGPIISKREVPIELEDTKLSLTDKLVKVGADLLIETLPDYLEDKIIPIPQDEKFVSFCNKTKKEDGEIKLDENDIKNYNKYRAFYGWPGVFFFKELNGKKVRIKITKAKLLDGKFVIEKIIQEGKKEITYK